VRIWLTRTAGTAMALTMLVLELDFARKWRAKRELSTAG